MRGWGWWLTVTVLIAVALLSGMIAYSIITTPQDPTPPVQQEPDLSVINAQNIEVLRELLEDETGKQITFMADGRAVE